ncbi:MAG: ABC transporter permease [Chloroflexi bacterium]|nr:ABC transporter permease [Chloroflexota bacterium]
MPGRWLGLRRRLGAMLRNPLMVFGLTVVVGMLLMALLAPVISPGDPTTLRLGTRLKPPSLEHPFGTDDLGRDILARVIWGSRISLEIGVAVVLVAGAIGFVLGATTGYVRGIFDDVVMRLVDIMLAFPPLVLAMAIASFLGPDLTNTMLAIAIVHIPKYVRLARSEALSLRETLFVQAAQAAGASGMRIVLRHIIPNSLSSILVVATLDFGLVILTAASLGFLGLGAQPPTPEWGLMVADGRKFLLDAPWYATFPGLAIMLVVIAANVFGDGLRDLLDPRLRQ